MPTLLGVHAYTFRGFMPTLLGVHAYTFRGLGYIFYNKQYSKNKCIRMR